MLFGFSDMMCNYEQRKIKNTKMEDGGVIDTASVTDSEKPHETGIKHPFYNDGSWVIVELYDTIEEAEKGHDKWIEIMNKNPEYLEDVNKSEIGFLSSGVKHYRKESNES